MKITILGSGTVDPRPHRASTGFYLEGAGAPIVIDLGANTLRNAMQAGLPMHTVEKVLLTHHHPDHTSDLVPFLFARKYATEAWRESVPLTVLGPAGTGDFLGKIFAAWPSVMPESGLSVGEIKTGEDFAIGPELRLSAFEAVHGDMIALSFRLRWADKVLSFSGDTALCPGVVQAARDADLFFCECSCFPRGQEPLYCRQVHLSWEDVAEICQQAGVRKVVLTHLYEPVMQRHPNPLESLTMALDIPVHAAADLSTYAL